MVTRYDIPCRGRRGTTYLTRWRLISTPWFGIYIHRIAEDDSMDQNMHDHPWSFWSFILWGGYLEEMLGTKPGVYNRYVMRRTLSIAFRPAVALHRILYLRNDKPVWTLIIRGRRKRVWGFQTKDGWVSHNKYFAS